MNDKNVKAATDPATENNADATELAAMNAALSTMLEEQATEIEALKAEVLQLKAPLQESNDFAEKLLEKSEKVVAKSGLQVTHNKKTYLVKHGVFLAGKNYTAADIAEDKAVLSRLIESKSSAVEAV